MHSTYRTVIGLAFVGGALATLPAARAAEPQPTRTADEIVGQIVGGEKSFSLSTTRTRPAATNAKPQSAKPAGTTAKPAAKTAAPLDMRVNFALGSAEMTEQSRAEAREFAKALKSPQLASMRFKVEGHTDASGERSLNVDLSKRRAQAVLDYLVAEGADGSKLIAVGYGFDRPRPGLAPKAAGNRRVEFSRTE